MTGVPRQIVVGPPGGTFPTGSIRTVEITPAGVAVGFDGGTATLPTEWLRDNCPCDRCRIAQTDERRWQPWLAPGAAQIRSVGIRVDELFVHWADGHESRYTADTFAAVEIATRRGTYTARLWSAGDQLERFDHDATMSDDVTRRRLFEAFLHDGAVIVTAAPYVPGTCIDFIRGLGLTVRETALGIIFDVLVDPSGFNVAYTSEAIPPHNDNAQCTHPPSGQVLAMLVNDATGGDSLVVDGWSVLEQLGRTDPAAIDVLRRVPVGFRQYSSSADGFTRAPMVVQDDAGRFTHLRFSNQLRQPLPFDHPELSAWYRAYRALGAAVTDPANQVTFRLTAGDMLLVNGLRVLHGRTEFRPDGPRHLQDIYFEVDDVIANLARMTGEATNAMATS